MRKLLILIAILVVAAIGWRVHDHSKQTPAAISPTGDQPVSVGYQSENQCSINTASKEVVVSISKQRMWACDAKTSVYDSAVITGMEIYPSERTPVGTYKIYAKQTNQTLAGHDFTGSWSDFVYYWLPFLNNKYGTYGFHDLTQTKNGSNGRADSDFGNIDVYSPYTAAKHGSHGCVELPLTASKWLYDWVSVGTTVSIVS